MTAIPRDIPLERWLPTSRREMERLGWDQADVIIVSGDAYVDHPSFGTALVGRLLEDLGLRVAILPQPNWQDDLRDFRKLGVPRLFFAVSAGCMDSMVNHYTANRRRRSDDAYTPGGRAGRRPDRATIVYSRILKQLYPDIPVVIGGIEASLRRITHYDFWDDALRPTILVDSGADLLVYGMGERPLTKLVHLLNKGVPFRRIDTLPQTALLRTGQEIPHCKNWDDQELCAHEDCLNDPKKQVANFARIEQESNLWQSKIRFLQRVGDQVLVLNPPDTPLTTAELDRVYALPYTRFPHPRYRNKGAIPAFEMVRHSVTLHRGCFGGCAFCTISAHQGKFIASRSEESILTEVRKLVETPGFQGTISDLGGPSANMYRMRGRNLDICRSCRKASCLHPDVCTNLDTRHGHLLELYRKVAAIPGIRHVQVNSGLRYDLFLHATDDAALAQDHRDYFEQLVRHHVSGRLKVAPEHSAPQVLNLMRKPSFELFERLRKEFGRICRQSGLKQQIIPYLISAHPGCDLEAMADLAVRLRHLRLKPEQVQLFTPTPMTLASEIFHAGINPETGEPVVVPRFEDARRLQHRLLFWHLPENRADLVRALKRAGLTRQLNRLYSEPDAAPRPRRRR